MDGRRKRTRLSQRGPEWHRGLPSTFPSILIFTTIRRRSTSVFHVTKREVGRRKKKEDANQMCRQRRQHQKRVASGPCHQLSRREHRPRLYLNALSSGYAMMTSALFWNPRRPTARRGGVWWELFLESRRELKRNASNVDRSQIVILRW